jgi:hypothetical protein
LLYNSVSITVAVNLISNRNYPLLGATSLIQAKSDFHFMSFMTFMVK